MKSLALAVIISVAVSAHTASAESVKGIIKKGNLLYDKGQYTEAAEKYEEALFRKGDSPVANFNLGAASYKKMSYLKAIDSFNKAIASGSGDITPQAVYNIGNTHYRIGNSQRGDPGKMREQYETAMEFYKRAMDLDPDDRDAKFNFELVRKKLEELNGGGGEEKQGQKTNQKKDQNKDQQKDQKKDQQQSEKEKSEKDKSESGKDENQKGGQGKSESKEEEVKDGQEVRSKGGEGEKKDDKKESARQSEEEKYKSKGEQEKQERPRSEKEEKSGGKGEGKESEEGKESREQTGGGEGEKEDSQEKPQEGEGLEAYQAPQEEGEREMTPEEARMLLEGYKGEEVTGRAIRLRKKPIRVEEPPRDW